MGRKEEPDTGENPTGIRVTTLKGLEVILFFFSPVQCFFLAIIERLKATVMSSYIVEERQMAYYFSALIVTIASYCVMNHTF